jgi:hypothetical protein
MKIKKGLLGRGINKRRRVKGEGNVRANMIKELYK